MINIIAVGDLFLGDYTVSLGYGIRSAIIKRGYDYHLGQIKQNISGSDILFGNLETVISEKGIDDKDIKTLICRGEGDSIKLLKAGGFNVLNVANNHIMQHGNEAFNDTINILLNNGIDVVGNGSYEKYTSKPVFKNIKGIKIGIIGYSFVRENFHKDNILYAFGHIDGVKRDIESLKKDVDCVIVSCHWGIEYSDKPSLNIQRMAREMVDMGASLILGHHPHVVQGIERYKEAVIFYSLGNFLFDFLWSHGTRESFIAHVKIKKNRIDYSITPVYINDKYQVVPMSQEQRNVYMKYLESISAFSSAREICETEDENYEYYVEANKIFKKHQRLKAFYVLKNIYRTDTRFIKYIIDKVIS